MPNICPKCNFSLEFLCVSWLHTISNFIGCFWDLSCWVNRSSALSSMGEGTGPKWKGFPLFGDFCRITLSFCSAELWHMQVTSGYFHAWDQMENVFCNQQKDSIVDISIFFSTTVTDLLSTKFNSVQKLLQILCNEITFMAQRVCSVIEIHFILACLGSAWAESVAWLA